MYAFISEMINISGSWKKNNNKVWPFAAGNPCRVLRQITEEDKIYFYKNRKFAREAWEAVEEFSSHFA